MLEERLEAFPDDRILISVDSKSVQVGGGASIASLYSNHGLAYLFACWQRLTNEPASTVVSETFI